MTRDPQALKRHQVVLRAVLPLILLFTAAPVTAQSEAETPNFATIRRSPFSGVDRANVKRWLDAQMTALFASNNPAEAGRELFFGEGSGLMTHFRAPDATADFRSGLAELTAQSFQQAYGDGKPGGTPAATYPLIALKLFERPSSAMVSAFQVALDDPSPGIRVLAVQGMATVRDQFNAQAWQSLATLVQRLASDERHDVTLGEMYRLLMVDDRARARASMQAISEILDARLSRFAASTALPSTADAHAIGWIASQWSTLGDNQARRPFVNQAGQVLTHAVYNYLIMLPESREVLKSYGGNTQQVEGAFQVIAALPPSVLRLDSDDTADDVAEKIDAAFSQLDTVFGSSRPRRVDLERTIRGVESSLSDMADPESAPSVSQAMLEQQGPTRVNQVVTELVKWIGNADNDGVLNASPWSLPKQLNVRRTLPNTPG